MFECHALTDIWTAGQDAKDNDRLRLTGLLGGIRWWCEAIVRGFSVRACDPVSEPCRGDQHCVICELFGKADPPQAAKFAVRAWEDIGRRQPFTKKLSKNSKVFLEFHFYRDWTFLEEYLLVKAMDVISRYGSVGGKTTLKPTRNGYGVPALPYTATKAEKEKWEKDKNAWGKRHADYGLLELKTVNGDDPKTWKAHREQFGEEMDKAAEADRETNNLPTLTAFWFLPGTTLFVHPSTMHGDDSFNNLLGLADTPRTRDDRQLTLKDWPAPSDVCKPLREHLRGIPEHSSLGDPVSKKVFSFGSIGNTKCARTWGYVMDLRQLTLLPALLISAGITKTAVDGKIVLRESIGG
jgi:hypothetical protein